MAAPAGRLLAVTPPQGDRDEILRFHRSERQLHWAIAIPFMVCYATALLLVTVYNPNPARPFRQVVSWVHRLSGICLFVLPVWTTARHRRDAKLYVHNIRVAWTWTLDDLKWLFLIGPASVSRRVALPHQGKFNAGEKVNFMVLTCTWPLYIVTGLIIWFGGVPYLSWLAHFSLALAATPLIAGHIMMATVNPDTRPGLSGMISGFVAREWARHHYRHWYEELYGHRGRKAHAVAKGVHVPTDGRLPHRCDHPAPAWVHLRGSALGLALAGCPHCRAKTRHDPAHDTWPAASAILPGVDADAALAPGGADASAAS